MSVSYTHLGEGKYPDDIDELDQPGLTYASAVRSKRCV